MVGTFSLPCWRQTCPLSEDSHDHIVAPTVFNIELASFCVSPLPPPNTVTLVLLFFIAPPPRMLRAQLVIEEIRGSILPLRSLDANRRRYRPGQEQGNV